MHKSTYNTSKTHLENYHDGPEYTGTLPEQNNTKTKSTFLGHSIHNPIGIAAGPLLNSTWIKLYAQLGFDILTYKTVRSVEKKSHPLPNCVYVDAQQIKSTNQAPTVRAAIQKPEKSADIAITNSFGVPSVPPEIWIPDIAQANEVVSQDQVVIVSITGTPGLEERTLIEDFAYTARLAKEAGAKIIEANYSCPNVTGNEGELFCDPIYSTQTSKAIREAIGDTPLIIKLGYMPYQSLKEILMQNTPYIDAVSGINAISSKITNENSEPYFSEEERLLSGVCGKSIQERSIEFTQNLIAIREELGLSFNVLGTGGIMSAKDMQERLSQGVDIAMTATAAMWNPWLAQEFIALKEKL